mmetsp:Transcript_8334/g.18683  ORF Transcript_8334/g.18683 Transcript_8334/m.18683 type:complete len:162 (+) Transcript_8334:904-1389(+)
MCHSCCVILTRNFAITHSCTQYPLHGQQSLPAPSFSNEFEYSNLPTTLPKSSDKNTTVVDESIKAMDDDVLFDPGGSTSTHPGNIKFRRKASELRPWHDQPTTSKEEKQSIADLLVESVTCEGHRFLDKGEDGRWHEVTGKGARKKANQNLRRKSSRRMNL